MSLSTLSTSTSSSMRPAPPIADRPRHAQVEQRLRRQPARAARLEQDALCLFCGSATCAVRRPRLAAEDTAGWRRTTNAGPRHVDAAHRAEHVRAIVGQPAARVGEIVGIAAERSGRRDGRGDTVLTCAPAAFVAAGRLQPGGPRERVRAERLPAVGSPLLDGHHEAVVGQRVVVGVGQQKAPIGGSS